MASQGTRDVWFSVLGFTVQVHSAIPSKEPQSKFVHRESGRAVGYSKTAGGEQVSAEDVGRSFPVTGGGSVVIDPAEFEKIVGTKRSRLEISHFIPASEIPLQLHEKPQYLAPAKGFEQPFILLRDTLRSLNVAAATKYMGKTGLRQSLAFVRPYGDILMLHQMRYPEEQNRVPQVQLPPSSFGEKEQELMRRLIEDATVPYDPADYSKTFDEEVQKFVDAKAAGQEQVVKQVEPEPTVNLMEVLRESVERMGKVREAKKPPKKMAGAARKREKRAAPKKKGA